MQQKRITKYKLGPKMKIFLDEQGYAYHKIAKRLGFNYRTFYIILRGERDFPKERYKDMMEFTGGFITLKDIVEAALKDFDFLEAIEGKEPNKCEVFIKSKKTTN